MKVFLTGSNGQLGWEIARQAPRTGLTVVAFDHHNLDITDKDRIHRLLNEHKPSLIVNAAAYTRVDEAEDNSRQAFLVNKQGPALLSQACINAHIPLIHLSTDYVFDGRKKSLYKEADPVSPLGVYGKSKQEGEERIRSCLKRHIILRTSWLYGLRGRNFVKTMIRLGKTQKTLSVVDDQYGSPTSAADLAEALLTIADKILNSDQIAWGTYHYCNSGITTWYDFTKAILKKASCYTDIQTRHIQPVKTADYPTKAKRPLFSGLDCSKLAEQFNIHSKPWQQSLDEMIDCFFKSSSNSTKI